MTKKPQPKKEDTGVEKPSAGNPCNTEFLLDKILEACREVKKSADSVKRSVDSLAERFGGGY